MTVAIGLIVVTLVPVAAQAQQSTQTLDIHCNPDRSDIAAMESEYARFGCWAHVGHHQYLVGDDVVYELWGGEGSAFSVEQHFGAPTEPGDVSPTDLQVNTTVPIETSLDGETWQTVEDAQYRFLPGDDRQRVEFSFDADGEPFRFLRVRQPRSAGQGLAGFLDRSVLTLEVTEQRPVDTPASHTGSVDLSCGDDILEDVFALHPCWFGGPNRWESPSFFHTYFVENATIDELEGSFITKNWREDDFGFLIQHTDGVLLQTSQDGVHWQTVAEVDTTHGVPQSFSVDLDEHPASFVRFASARHPDWGDHPALKHPASMFLHSELTVTGDLPAGLG